MYKKRWTPSKTQRREFAQRMQNDPEYAAAYEARKTARIEKQREKMSNSCEAPGSGLMYYATQAQHDFCVFKRTGVQTSEQEDACNMVASAYSCNEKVDHYYLHIVAELMRTAAAIENGYN